MKCDIQDTHQIFVLKIPAIGKSIPGELYWRSSDPLCKNEYFLNFIFNFLYASSKDLSEIELAYFDNMHECCLSSPMHVKLYPPIIFFFKCDRCLLK